ncbi:MAG TPA: hypothetical protein VNP72_04760 [Longimicrobium sp.]|nr:hypothetical protein [Longimicrobium sp.]
MALLGLGRAAGALLLAAAAGGCGELTRPSIFVPGDPQQLLVHAVLHAGRDSAAVLVSRVGTGASGTPVAGAQVRLAGPAGQAVLPESPEGRAPCTYRPPGTPPEAPGGCYAAAVPGGIVAGAEYRLEVALPTGERATGTTVVPLPPALLSPAEGLRMAADSQYGGLLGLQPLALRWTAPGPVRLSASVARTWPGVTGADVQCYAGVFRFGEFPEVPPQLEADSATVRVGASCSAPGSAALAADSVDVAVAVTAYDSAYIAYARTSEHGLPGRDAHAGLQGANGVFGSAAAAVRRVRLFRP